MQSEKFWYNQCKYFCSIYYESATFNDSQVNYKTMEKDLLEVCFTFEKFQSYQFGMKVIVRMDHSTLIYLLGKRMKNLN